MTIKAYENRVSTIEDKIERMAALLRMQAAEKEAEKRAKEATEEAEEKAEKEAKEAEEETKKKADEEYYKARRNRNPVEKGAEVGARILGLVTGAGVPGAVQDVYTGGARVVSWLGEQAVQDTKLAKIENAINSSRGRDPDLLKVLLEEKARLLCE